jgi:hypothetical protein
VSRNVTAHGTWASSLERSNEWKMGKEIGREGADWINLAQERQMADSSEHSNEHSSCIKGTEFLDQLGDY